jgi:hypothetical protein
MLCAPGLVVSGIEGVGSRIHVLCSRTRFRRYRGRRLLFSRFARSEIFSAVPWASGSFIKFCATRHIFGGTEGVCSRFHVLRARTHFRRYRGPQLMFSCFATRTHFRWYRGRRVLFQCLARPDSFPIVPQASGLILMFCSPGLVFDGTEGVGSHFHVLRSRNRFRRYRGRRVPFSYFALPYHFRRYRGRQVPLSYFALPDSFLMVPRASAPVFIFCVPGLIFDDTEGVGSRFQV